MRKADIKRCQKYSNQTLLSISFILLLIHKRDGSFCVLIDRKVWDNNSNRLSMHFKTPPSSLHNMSLKCLNGIDGSCYLFVACLI